MFEEVSVALDAPQVCERYQERLPCIIAQLEEMTIEDLSQAGTHTLCMNSEPSRGMHFYSMYYYFC